MVIWNPSAGSTTQADQLRQVLTDDPSVELIETQSREEAIQQVRRAADQRFRRVIAAGGDGTVNAVVTALFQSVSEGLSTPELAVLPLGSGNDLARSLGMPLDPHAALEICLQGAAAPMDLLEIELEGSPPRVAGNMVTAGNTGKYLNILTDELKQRWGALCYLWGAVNLLDELEAFRAELHIDEAPPVTVDMLNVFFANGRTSGGGMTVSPGASLDDGLMNVLVIRDGDGLDLAGLTMDYLASDVRENDLVSHYRCRRMRVVCTSPLPLSTDGDAAEARQLTVSVRPGAINAVRGPES